MCIPKFSYFSNIFNRKYLFHYILLVFVVGCSSNSSTNNSDDEEVITTELYFTFKDNSNTSYTDNWIILHNENGELLDYKEYEQYDYLTFETDSHLLTNKILVSLFYREEFTGNVVNIIATTTDVNKGSIWDNHGLDIPEYSDTETGNFNLVINNSPYLIGEILVSNNNLSNVSSSGSGSSIGGVWTYLRPNISLYEENDYFISIRTENFDPKYAFLTDVQDGDDISLDYEHDFMFFDSYLPVNVPANSSYYDFGLKAFEEDQEYRVYDGYSVFELFGSDIINPTTLNVGYTDLFDKYITSFYVAFDDHLEYSYRRLGSKPSSGISIPENHTIDVINSTVENFEFSTNFSFETYSSTWFKKEGSSRNDDLLVNRWTITSPYNASHKAGDFPDELIQLYPDLLNISSLGYSGTSFTLNSEEKLGYKEN
jgi:hypothetical protein